jgi:Tfp pilus assembly protein PilV
MPSTLTRYKIGLAVLGLFSIGLLGMVLVQANGAKQDNTTYKKAQEVAQKLNAYTLTKSVPSSLAAAGITDVPSTISYNQLSSTSYKFCVTYKTSSSGFDASNVQSELLSGGAVSSSSYYDSSTSSYLSVDSTHHKGQNCQTVKSYSYDSSSLYNKYTDPYSSSSSSSSSNYDYNSSSVTKQEKAADECDKKYPASGSPGNDKAYSDCLDKAYGTSSLSN